MSTNKHAFDQFKRGIYTLARNILKDLTNIPDTQIAGTIGLKSSDSISDIRNVDDTTIQNKSPDKRRIIFCVNIIKVYQPQLFNELQANPPHNRLGSIPDISNTTAEPPPSPTKHFPANNNNQMPANESLDSESEGLLYGIFAPVVLSINNQSFCLVKVGFSKNVGKRLGGVEVCLFRIKRDRFFL